MDGMNWIGLGKFSADKTDQILLRHVKLIDICSIVLSINQLEDYNCVFLNSFIFSNVKYPKRMHFQLEFN